jgi:beta-lactamase regulating signal transducer with metallopeptidase domain/Leucine-rich repeat (LRR) protein
MFAYVLHSIERIADYCWPVFPEACLGATLILLIAALANLTLIRAGAAVRHRTWSLATLGLLTFPLLGMILPRFHFDYGRLFAASEVAQSDAAQNEIAAPTEPVGFGGMIYSPPTGENAYAVAHFATMPPPSTSGISNNPPAPEEPAFYLKLIEAPWREIILALWAAGAALGIGSYAKSHFGARSLAKNSILCTDGVWINMADGVEKRLGLRHKVRISFSRATASPLMLGWLRPTILLPAHSEQWPHAQRLAVLVHEMSHITRRDIFWQNMARAAGILYWFHPLMWLASWRMRVERELACDDAVIHYGERPSNYASLLLEVAAAITGRTKRLHGGVAMACRSSVERRIAAILNPNQTHTPVGRRASWAMFAAAACVVALGAMFNPVVREQPADAAANVADMQADKPDESSLGEVPQDQAQHDTADETVVQDSQNNRANNQEMPVGGMAHQPNLAFAGYGGYANESPMQNKPQNKEETPERTLNFPDDRSLGELSVRDENFERTIDDFIYCSSDASWEPLCEARGAVKAPAGKVVRLRVTEHAVRDLSPLLKLGANDLYKLDMFFVPAEDQVMQHVAHLSGLKELDLEGSSIRDRGMAYIDRLKSLEYLRLPNNITDKCLPAVSKLPHLKGLYFKNTRVTNNGLRAISKMKTLEELELGGRNLDDECLEHITGLPKLGYLMLCGEYTGSGFKHLRKIPTLKIVNLENNPQNSDAGLEHVAALPNLENLTLRNNPLISDKGMAFLARSRSLKKLEISKTQVTARGVEYLANIESIECLYLPDSSLADDALAHVSRLKDLKVLGLITPYYNDPRLYEKFYTAKGVAELDGLDKLEELSISGPGIDDESVKHIAKHTRLKKLNIWGPQLGNKGLHELAKLRSLEYLEIPFGGVTLGGLAALNDLPHLKSLRVLKVVDDGLPMNIGGCTELESLTLWMDRVNSTDDDDLACLEKLKKLKEFNSSISWISDAGLAHLGGLTDLKFLAVGGPNVTDAGVAHLSNLKKLNILHIFGNISDAGLKAFEGLHSLQLLDILSKQNISPAAIDKLKKALPGTDRIIVEHNSNLAGQPKSLRIGDAAPPLSVKDDEGEGGRVKQKSDSTTAALIGGVQKVSMTVSADAADVDRTKTSTTSMREIKFPNDRSLGRLFIRDENFKRTINDFAYHMADVDWKSLGEARGSVKIPAGNVVRLIISKEAARDLSPLSKLGANDIYTLEIGWIPVDDRAMQYVAHLTGLNTLYMFEAPIGDEGMAYVGRLKSLEYLTLPKNITDKGLPVVGKLPRLKGLYFKANRITNDGLKALSKLDTLEELELGGKSINDDGLQHLAGLPRLNYLLLWGDFTGSGFMHLREIPTLRIVNLFRMKTTQDAGLEHLAALPALENLSLFDNSQISDQGMAYLAKSKSLKKLSIGATQVTAHGVEYLSEIKTLESLDLPDARVTDAALESISRLNKLKALHMSLNPKRSDDFHAEKGLAALDKLEELEDLDVSGPVIDDETVKHIAIHRRLKKLVIVSSGLGDSGLKELAKLRSLERLNLVFNHVSLGGLSALNDLSKLKSLEVLGLIDDGRTLDIGGCKELERLYFHMATGNSLINEDLRCLKNLKKLKELQIGHMSTISDAGLACLSGLTEMEILTIGGPNVTDAGLAHFSNMNKLWMLNICGDISGDGLQKLRGLKMLNMLMVTSGQNINQKAVDKFKKSMPGEVQVTINYY